MSKNGNIRRLAASALGKIGDTRAVIPLLDLLKTETRPQVRQYAIKALGEMNDKSPVFALEKIENDPNEKDYVREAARVALSRISTRSVSTEIQGKKINTSTNGLSKDPVADYLARPHPRRLPGPWDSGWALGFHSAFSGAEWSRSGPGDLTYRLKYQGDMSVIPALVDQSLAVIADHPELLRVDALIPVPPSVPRPSDPVSSFASALALRLNRPLQPVLVKSRRTDPQKELNTLAQKRLNVANAFILTQPSIRGKRLLVIDDLFDSGATLEEIYRLLHRSGAAAVHVLTLTRTIHSEK